MAIERNPKIETPQMASATFSKKVKRMLGLDLDGWNTAMVVFLALAASAAIAVGVSQFVIIKLQKSSEVEAKQEFERYKVETGEKIAEANTRAAEANEHAAKADLARVELESKLVPRSLNQEQWDFIQGLRGKFSIISIAYEVDAETVWFAGQIRDAFFSAGIGVAMYPRAADVHSFGTFIFEPNGFEGSRPRTAEPLIEIFNKSEHIGSLAVITELPSDVVLSIGNTRLELRAPLDTPMIILGGRFVIPPPHLERAARAAKAARDNMRKNP